MFEEPYRWVEAVGTAGTIWMSNFSRAVQWGVFRIRMASYC